MWRSSIFLKSLRDHRIAILGWGSGMGFITAATMASVSTLAATPEARAQLVSLAATFAWNAEAVAVDTIGGYATFKIGLFIFLIAIWPLLTASRTLRGEEDRGSLDMLLALPRSRVRVAIEKVAAMWSALLLMGVLIALITFAGGSQFGADFGLGDALLFGLDLALFCMVVGGVTLLVSQFTSEAGPAAGIGAALLLFFIVVDMVHRVMPGTEWISQLSPAYYYNLSKPLVPRYGTNAGGMLVLLALALSTSAVAVWLFVRRDVGRTVPLPPWLHLPVRRPSRTLPSGDWSLQSVYRRSLGMIALPTMWWTLAITGLAGWIVVVVKQVGSQIAELIQSSPAAAAVFANIGGGDARVTAAFLSAMFVLLPLLLMAFAVTQVNGWTGDEQDGRLDLVLATPQSRMRVLLGRFAALATATTFIAVATLVVTAAAAAASGLELSTPNLAAATLGMIPLALLIAAIGYLAAGWLTTAVDTGLLSFLLAIWFLISFIGPELQLPDPALRLSAFYYYGTPLLHGVSVMAMGCLLVVGAVALALGTMRFVHKDIGR